MRRRVGYGAPQDAVRAGAGGTFPRAREKPVTQGASRSVDLESVETTLAWLHAKRGDIGRGDVASNDSSEAAVAALFDSLLAFIESEGVGPDQVQVPAAAIADAQRSAWDGVALREVLTTWIGVSRALGQRLLATPGPDLSVPLLQRLHQTEGDLLKGLVGELTRAYMAEYDVVSRSTAGRREELVRRLLGGEDLDASALVAIGYDFDRWHVGIAAWGADARATLQAVAAHLGRDLLIVETPEVPLAAWLASGSAPAHRELDRLVAQQGERDIALSVGSPARGLAGWRLTHDQARAALPVARQRTQQITYCADVLLDAAVLQSAMISESLSQRFLAPLDGLRMGGSTARETLRAYFACGRSISSTASLLKVTRKTVERRILLIEGALQRSLRDCLELEVALRLEATAGAVA